MSLITASNRWLNRIYKSIAVLLVLLAVLISALRLFLPYVQNHKIDLQNYLTDTYDSSIVIGDVAMDWRRSGPVLIVKKIQLFDSEINNFSIEEVSLNLDFWDSLARQKIVTDNFILTGVNLSVDRALLERDKQHQKSNKLAGESAFSALTDLFFEQIDHFSLRDSEITIVTGKTSRNFLISNLDWVNKKDRHLAKGNVIIDGLTTDYLAVSLDVVGSSQDMSGQLYVQGSNLNITPWLDRILSIDNEKISSSINFSAWLGISQGKAQQLDVLFGDNVIRWNHDKVDHQLVLQGGQLRVNHPTELNRLSVLSSELPISLDNETWQPLTINVDNTDEALSVYLSYFNLKSIQALYPLFLPDQTVQKTLNKLALQGDLHHIYAKKQYNEDYPWQLSVDFSKFNSDVARGIPGIKNASGNILFANQKVSLDMSAADGALDFGDVFVLPIPYHALNAALTVDINEQGWQLKSQQLALVSDELHFSAELGIKAPVDNLASMSLLATITKGQVQFAHHYFPLPRMKPSLVKYLKNGLLSGDVEQALVIYDGAFKHFPFGDGSGIFTVDVELKNTEFNFHDKWANIKNLDANLNFTNNSMMITGRSGQLSNLDMAGVEIGIEELKGSSILTVDVALDDVNPKHITQLMEQSTLKDSIGGALNKLVIGGPVSGQFNLALPLKAHHEVVATGLINLDNNMLSLHPLEMEFTDISGQLSFSNDQITVNDLQLSWFELPLQLSLTTENKANYFQTNIDLAASWSKNNWKQQVPAPLKKYARGDLNWRGDISLHNIHGGGVYYALKLNSTLEGLQLNLPAPYNKKKKVHLPVSIESTGQGASSTIKVNLGKELHFDGLLTHGNQDYKQFNAGDALHITRPSITAVEDDVIVSAPFTATAKDVVINKIPLPPYSYFSRAHLSIGNEQRLLPMQGFQITTALEYAALSQWQPFILDTLASIDLFKPDPNKKLQRIHPLLDSPERLSGTINEFELLGETLHNVSFDFGDKKDHWLLDLNAKELRSEITIHPDWLVQGIDVHAEFFHINQHLAAGSDSDQREHSVKSAQAKKSNIKNALIKEHFVQGVENIDSSHFTDIPPVRLICESCRFNKLDFGKLNLEITRPKDDIIELKHFNASRDRSSISLNGYWQHNKNTSETRLSGKVITADVEFEMKKLGYASTIKESGGELNLTLNWQGSPVDASLAQMNGEISTRLDDGYLAEVSDKGLRVLSILSLDSLARKLKLDFRDIFSDGMFYNYITGDFNLKSGILYTKNTKMNGTAGDLSMIGNTNLASGALDYRLLYKPNLTSSLPVLAWVATLNPVVFLTGLAINEVITSSVISEVNFELTGTVNTPNLKEVNRKSKNISVGRSQPPKIIEKNETENFEYFDKKGINNPIQSKDSSLEGLIDENFSSKQLAPSSSLPRRPNQEGHRG